MVVEVVKSSASDNEARIRELRQECDVQNKELQETKINCSIFDRGVDVTPDFPASVMTMNFMLKQEYLK